MIGRYMSDDQLADHVSHQMTFFHKKYEPEVEPVTEEKKKYKKKVKFKKNKQGSESNTSDDEETEKEIEKRENREGIRDRMLEDLELLRDYYKRIYKKALNEKVANQRKEFRHRNAEAIARQEKLKEKEEKQKHKVVIRLPKSKVLNDQSYKEGIPETAYHKIIKLEHQLKKQGYLAKVSEIKAFWDFILMPGNLARILEKGKMTWEEVQQYEKSHRSILEASDDKGNQKWTSSDIDQLIAANTTAKYWKKSTHARARLFTPTGLTDISSSLSGRQLSPASSPSKQKSGNKSASSNAMTLEQKFPKVEFPPLAAYTLVFGEQEPDPEEIEKQLEIERKEQAKRDTRDKLLTMFSHALANRAATQRLMQRNEKFSFSQLVGTSSVRELLYHDAENEVRVLPLTAEALQTHDEETRTSVKEEEMNARSDSTSPKPTRTESPNDKNIDKDRILMLHEYKRLPPIAVPLSLQGLEESCPIKEAQGLSSLWVNPFLNKTSQVTGSE